MVVVIAISLVANLYQFLDKPNEAPIVVNDSQLECLSNRGANPITPVRVVNLRGPESFQNMKVAYFHASRYSKGFEYEFSNCFYDQIIQNVKISEVDTAISLVSHLGGSKYYFYKPLSSETFDIYIKE